METALVLTLLTTLLFTGAVAQSSGCTNALISLSPCLSYITGNSSSTPSSSCCSQLQTVVRSQPDCLCAALTGGASPIGGLDINRTQALGLPAACNVQTPAVSQCNAAAPAGAPGPSDSPNTSGTGGNGSKTIPTTNNKSEGNTANLTFSLLFFLVFVASYVAA